MDFLKNLFGLGTSDGIVHLTVPEFDAALSKANLDNIVVLDVRTAQETATGMIPTAIVIDYMSAGFGDKVTKLDKSKTYYVYCRSGNRSGKACKMMQSMGFENTINLKGGMLAWEAAGFDKTT